MPRSRSKGTELSFLKPLVFLHRSRRADKHTSAQKTPRSTEALEISPLSRVPSPPVASSQPSGEAVFGSSGQGLPRN